MLSHSPLCFTSHFIHRLNLFSIQVATMFSRLTKNCILISLLSITATGVFFSFSWNLSVYFPSIHKSSLCGCHKCLTEGDPWFRNLINLSPKPFLSRINKTSEDAFNWWKVNVHLFLKRSEFLFFCNFFWYVFCFFNFTFVSLCVYIKYCQSSKM